MATFGGYEIVEELYRTPFGYVCSARRAGAEQNGPATEFVVKVYEAPDTDGDGLPGPDLIGSDGFLGRARLQQKLAQANARHWAPIHELGLSDGKPFYVTDYYPRTAQKLIAGRVVLGATGLHDVIGSIAHGLRELQDACGQPHGSLKPSNILIGGAGEVSGAKIVLTDPLCGDDHRQIEQGADLHALGALLYQLVMHRPFHDPAWPVEDSEEWSHLGKFAGAWRALCTALLDPDVAHRPDPQALDRTLAELAPHGLSVRNITHIPGAAARKVPVRKIAVGVLILALAAAGGGAFVYFKQSASRAHVRQARAQWLDALWSDKPALARYASFGAPVMRQSDWDLLQLPDRPKSLADFGPSAIRRSQSAAATADQVRGRLLDVYQKSAVPLRDLQQSYDHDGYTQAAGFIGSIVTASPPDDAHLLGAINARIALADKLKSTRPAISPATAAALKGMDQSKDKDLQGFAATMRDALRRECVLTADGWSGAPRLDELARQISSVQDWPDGYDEDRLNRDEKLDAHHLQIEDIQHWLSVANQYAWASPAEPQRGAAQKLAAQLAANCEQVRKELLRFLAADSAEAKKLDQERGELQKQIDQLAAARFVRKDLPAAFDGPAKKLNDQIASLPSRYKYQPSDLATWFGQMQAQHFNSTAAQDAWARWMKGHTLEGIDAAWKAKTTAMAKTLADLESKTFSVPAALEQEPWATPSHQMADDAVARTIGQLAPGAAELPPEQLAAAKNDFAAWCDEVTKLKLEHARLQKTMINAVTLNEHDHLWAADGDRKFWATQVEAGTFMQVMKPELQRIQTIRAVLGESSVEKLLADVQTSNRPEVILAVWSRLGSLQKRIFAGPVTAAGVEKWSDLLAKVDTASERLAPLPHSAVQKQVATCGQQMWLSAINAADSPELLEAAGAAAAKLHLTPDSTALSPLQRFDLALSDAIRSNSAENLSAVSARFATLPEWDRSALQQLAAGGDITRAAINKRSYLWPAGETERKGKWQSPHVNPADQLAKASALIEDYQPRSAKAALEGLSGPEVDALRKQIDELEQSASVQLKQGNTYFLNHRYPLAFREFQQAARGGSDEAMLHLGHMYREGAGVPRNRNLELKFFRLASAAGNVEAMGELAGTYLSFPQWPVDADAPEVAAWFKTAADAGNLDAMAGLAQIALQKHDLAGASKVLTDADAHDSERKGSHLGPLMRQLAKLYDARRDSALARKWFQAAADRGDSEAEAWLRR
jgi:TPR repeat protein